jgi:hypothetical protein
MAELPQRVRSKTMRPSSVLCIALPQKLQTAPRQDDGRLRKNTYKNAANDAHTNHRDALSCEFPRSMAIHDHS